VETAGTEIHPFDLKPAEAAAALDDLVRHAGRYRGGREDRYRPADPKESLLKGSLTHEGGMVRGELEPKTWP
jgi:hypothetical protein